MLDYIKVDINISSDNPFLFAYPVFILNIIFTIMLSK